MAVLSGALGFASKLALAPLRDHPEFMAAHQFHGTPQKAEGRHALKTVRATPETLDITLVEENTVFAFMHDLPLLYSDEYEIQAGKAIPLLAFRALRNLGESQLAILGHLRTSPADMGALVKDMGLAPSTLSVHMQRRAEASLVDVERHARNWTIAPFPIIMRTAGGVLA